MRRDDCAGNRSSCEESELKIILTQKGVIWSYLASITSLLGGVVILFSVLAFLDQSYVSLWYIFTSIGAMTVLFDFGFSVTFARNITYCWSGASELLPESVSETDRVSEPNFVLMNKVLSTCRLIYFLISAVVLLGCLTIGSGYISWVSRGVDGNLQFISWAIYSVAIFLNIYYGYYSSFLRGVGAVDLANKNTVIAKLFQIALLFVLLFAGLGILGASIAYLSYGFVYRILCKRDFLQYEGIGEELARVATRVPMHEIAGLFAVVWHNAWREGIISLSGYACAQAGTIVTSLYLPLEMTGVYSLCLQMATMVSTIAGTLYVASEPSLQDAMASKDIERVRSVMGVSVSATIWVSVLIGGLAVLLAPPFVELVKSGYSISRLLLFELCAYQVLLKVRDCYATYFSASNRVPYVWSYCLSAILGIAFSAFALWFTKGNVHVFVMVQALPQLAWNVWIWPFRAHREMGVSMIHLISDGTSTLAVKLRDVCARACR